LDFQSNRYITKMYGTMNIKLAYRSLHKTLHQLLIFHQLSDRMFMNHELRGMQEKSNYNLFKHTTIAS
jgi:hypothetical protein